MRLIGGVERKVVRRREEDRREEDTEGEINKEKIRGAIKRLKDGEAADIDEIPSQK